MIVWSTAPQGTTEWLDARRGIITASRFRDARDRLKNGDLSAKATLYAMDVARERVGGKAPEVFVNAAMRFGQEQEQHARMAYEDATGNLVELAGFAYTEDRKFGVSVDGLIDDPGVWECKAMVSSDTLFKAVVDGDISDYVDQCNGAMWLLHRQWVDLCLWAPDLPDHKLKVIRITRNEETIDKLVADLVSFERLVSQYEARLRALMSPGTPPWSTDPTPPAKPETTLAAAELAPSF